MLSPDEVANSDSLAAAANLLLYDRFSAFQCMEYDLTTKIFIFIFKNVRRTKTEAPPLSYPNFS
jgi:hypothetical protein